MQRSEKNMNINSVYAENTVVFKGIVDYDLAQTFNCGQCFRWDENNGIWQGFAAKWKNCKKKARIDQMRAFSLLYSVFRFWGQS
jgi:hypothetical protein